MDATSHLRDSLDSAVALANVAGAEQRQGRARVDDPVEVRAGVVEALRLSVRQVPAFDEAGLADLVAGGRSLYAVLVLVADEALDDAAERVNVLLRESRAAPALVRHENGPWHLHFSTTDATPAARSLADLATAVGMLIGSDEAGRLHVCRAERCDNVFLDTTRNGVRRFCSTSCQNRTKVADFRARSLAQRVSLPMVSR
jgi:predicted RNA-binding Zn ribbon-like protein